MIETLKKQSDYFATATLNSLFKIPKFNDKSGIKWKQFNHFAPLKMNSKKCQMRKENTALVEINNVDGNNNVQGRSIKTLFIFLKIILPYLKIYQE